MSVCALGLLFDRLVLRRSATEPSAAHAGVEPPRPRRAGADLDPPDRQEPIPELPFPRGLEPIESVAGIRDPFAPPDNGDGLSPGGRRRQPQRSARESFVAAHRLEAVMEDDGLSVAIVSGRWLRTGQSLDGCRLAAIDGIRVAFECVDGVAVLELASSDVRGPR